MIQSFSVQKLGFFLVGGFLGGLLVAVLAGLVVALANSMESLKLLGLLIVPVLVAIGLFGVLSGGVARLVYLDRQTNTTRWTHAVNFCGQRFLALFLGTLATVFVILLTLGFVQRSGRGPRR